MALFVALVALIAAWWLQPVTTDSHTYRASILPLDEAPIVGLPPGRFAISPDGRYLCFVSGRAGKPNTLWLRSLDRDQARELTGTDGAQAPFWSHDGRFIGFFAEGKLKKLDIAGGPPVSLTDADTGATAGTWSKDNIIVFPRLKGGLYRIHAGGGPVAATTSLDVAAGTIGIGGRISFLTVGTFCTRPWGVLRATTTRVLCLSDRSIPRKNLGFC